MRKRIRFVKKISVMLAAAGMISTGISVVADSGIESKGNYIFDGEKVSVYASDIDYLQSELDALFQELP